MTQIIIDTPCQMTFKSLLNGEIFMVYGALYIKLNKVVNSCNCLALNSGSLEHLEPNTDVVHITKLTAKA